MRSSHTFYCNGVNDVKLKMEDRLNPSSRPDLTNSPDCNTPDFHSTKLKPSKPYTRTHTVLQLNPFLHLFPLNTHLCKFKQGLLKPNLKKEKAVSDVGIEGIEVLEAEEVVDLEEIEKLQGFILILEEPHKQNQVKFSDEEKYMDMKAKLFERMVDPERHRKFVNSDDLNAPFFIAQGNSDVPVVTFALKNKRRHNIYNILAVVAVGIAVGAPLEDIVRGIEDVDGVPGRCKLIDEEQAFGVIVDYAHTLDACLDYLMLLSLLDIIRLAVQAAVAIGEESDVVVSLTNPDLLLFSVEDLYVNKTKWVGDRSKGHETYQIEGYKKEFFDVQEECREALHYVNELHQAGLDMSEFVCVRNCGMVVPGSLNFSLGNRFNLTGHDYGHRKGMCVGYGSAIADIFYEENT
ncbi:hypothetical protein HHK36_001157 [Tetracentron sinense]|uniref:Uncharacterized protein n=1 Tax=Tetracentron sinense TaxID=13715 RepID=A0A835A2B0_TETSI|nr:hypothetical protein HHK36_001157 [Tetracentron sinense]